MITQFQKRKKKTISMGNFFGLVAFIIILSIIGFLVFSNLKIKQTKDKLNIQLAAIEKEIKDLQKKNEGLKEGISRVGDEDYIERIAREELNLQKEGEMVVSFILPEPKEEEGPGKRLWQPSYWREWFKGKWQWLKNIF